MPITGYSDRVNHALAYAAKYHDQQVRKGLRAPYFTQPANIGIILTRYGRDDAVVVAGILHDVVEECAREGHGGVSELDRVADKFGADVVQTLRGVTERRTDDEGVELSTDERHADLLARIATASEAGRWVCAANALHDAGTLIADLQRTDYPETVWTRRPGGRDATVRRFRALHDALATGSFDAPLMAELREAVEILERTPG